MAEQGDYGEIVSAILPDETDRREHPETVARLLVVALHREAQKASSEVRRRGFPLFTRSLDEWVLLGTDRDCNGRHFTIARQGTKVTMSDSRLYGGFREEISGEQISNPAELVESAKRWIKTAVALLAEDARGGLRV